CSLLLYIGLSRSFFFFSSRRRHTRFSRDWSSDVCSSDLLFAVRQQCHRPAALKIADNCPVSLAAPEREVVDADDGELVARLFSRSEERRVGKECRSGWSGYQ